MTDLREKLEEWQDTKSIAIAYEICEELCKEMEAFDGEPELD